MDFTFTEEQETIAELARELFERRATPERLTELETGETRYDPALWQERAAADLLGTGLREDVGGNGGGFLELGVLLAEVGAAVAPVPAYATLALGADPTRPATTARRDGTNWRLDGAKELAPAAQRADTVLIPAGTDDGAVGLFLLPTDAHSVEVRPVATTNNEAHADVFPDGAVDSNADRLDCPIGALHTRALVALCAIQLGVADAFRRPTSPSSGRPTPVLALPAAPNTSTAGSESTSPIPCIATFCGPSTTNSPSVQPPHSWPAWAAHIRKDTDDDHQCPHENLAVGCHRGRRRGDAPRNPRHHNDDRRRRDRVT